MKRNLIFIFLVAFVSWIWAGEIVYGVLERVKDGDTFQMRIHGKSESIRLFGIDTPEKFIRRNRKLNRDVRMCGVGREAMVEAGQEASHFAEQVMEVGKTYKMELMEGSSHGRLIGWVYLPDGKVYNVEVVRQGYGVVYRKYSRTHHQKDRELMKAQKYAQTHQKGLWSKYPSIMKCMAKHYTEGIRRYTTPSGLKLSPLFLLGSIALLAGLLFYMLKK